MPQQEIDVAHLGVYTPLKAGRTTCPVALVGAWRAADGDVGVAVAHLGDAPLRLPLSVPAQDYGLPARGPVYRIDHTGRQLLGTFEGRAPTWTVDLAPRALCVFEFGRTSP